jgi:hypothetical protein
MRILIVLMVLCEFASAMPVKFRVRDEGGNPAKGVLVIVQNLESHEAEVLRVLSDEQGDAGSCELQPGLYRMIATTPYGLWQTKIKEFVVGSSAFEMALRLKFMPTHGYGDIVVVGTTWVELKVLRPDGEPASGAALLVRDHMATLHMERWYKTDAEGRTKIEMISDPFVLVILYHDAIMTTELAEGNVPKVIKFSPD